MEIQNILIGVGAFAFCVLLFEAILYLVRSVGSRKASEVRKRLKGISTAATQDEVVNILRKRQYSSIRLLDTLLSHMPLARRVDRILEQGNLTTPLGLFVLLAFVLGISGFLVLRLAAMGLPVSIGGALLLGFLPVLYVKMKRNARMRAFERQLPDALDLVARAMKAGHALPSGMKMVADEFSDPIGPEFGKTLDEIHFGLSSAQALNALGRRVEVPDLQFFIVSVLIQRETGGNLAEIIENTSRLIRERFKLLGRVRVLAAEGKISAYILVALPFLIALLLNFTSPGYMNILITDPVGRVMVGTALGSMLLGIIVIRKMIEIKV